MIIFKKNKNIFTVIIFLLLVGEIYGQGFKFSGISSGKNKGKNKEKVKEKEKSKAKPEIPGFNDTDTDDAINNNENEIEAEYGEVISNTNIFSNYNADDDEIVIKTKTNTLLVKEPVLNFKTDMGQCICDVTYNKCDVNCCCDPDCSGEKKYYFLGECLPEGPEGKEKPLCSNLLKAVNNPNVIVSDQYSDSGSSILCIAMDHNPDMGYYYKNPGKIEDKTVFINQFKRLLSTFSYSDKSVSLILPQTNYMLGKPIIVANETQNTYTKKRADSKRETILQSYAFTLPENTISGKCEPNSPILFLIDKETECTRKYSKSKKEFTIDYYKMNNIVFVRNPSTNNVTYPSYTEVKLNVPEIIEIEQNENEKEYSSDSFNEHNQDYFDPYHSGSNNENQEGNIEDDFDPFTNPNYGNDKNISNSNNNNNNENNNTNDNEDNNIFDPFTDPNYGNDNNINNNSSSSSSNNDNEDNDYIYDPFNEENDNNNLNSDDDFFDPFHQDNNNDDDPDFYNPFADNINNNDGSKNNNNDNTSNNSMDSINNDDDDDSKNNIDQSLNSNNNNNISNDNAGTTNLQNDDDIENNIFNEPNKHFDDDEMIPYVNNQINIDNSNDQTNIEIDDKKNNENIVFGSNLNSLNEENEEEKSSVINFSSLDKHKNVGASSNINSKKDAEKNDGKTSKIHGIKISNKSNAFKRDDKYIYNNGKYYVIKKDENEDYKQIIFNNLKNNNKIKRKVNEKKIKSKNIVSSSKKYNEILDKVVLQVKYKIYYTIPTGNNLSNTDIIDFVDVEILYEERNIKEDELVTQKFSVVFLRSIIKEQEKSDPEVEESKVKKIKPRKTSGNPGYIFGKELLTSKLVNGTLEETTGFAIPKNILTHDKLRCPMTTNGNNSNGRIPVTFGNDMISECTLPIDSSINSDYSEISKKILEIHKITLNSIEYIARFGNTTVDNAWEWVKMIQPENVSSLSSCDTLPTELALQFIWADVGAINNPQPMIIGARAAYGTTGNVCTCTMGNYDENDCDNNRKKLSYNIKTTVSFLRLPDHGTELYEPRAPRLIPAVDEDLFYPFFIRSQGQHRIKRVINKWIFIVLFILWISF